MILEDFQADASGWQYISDRVMGGVSDGGAQLDREGETVFARLTGQVSTANNGGFIQMRRDLDTALPADSTGLTLTQRGNAEVYYIHLRTKDARRPWQYFQAPFTATADWQDATVNWSAFKPQGGLSGALAATDILSIGIVAFGRDHAADLSVAEIRVDVP